MDFVIAFLLWFAALSAGIMAGVYFTFSTFAMRAFAALGDEAGSRAMQSVNRVILRSLFLPLFFASSLVSAALVVIGLLGAGSTAMIAGGAIYVVGMFGVTVLGNVPLNNRLDETDPASEDGRTLWRDYLRRWTRLNHIRTIACILSCGFFVLALQG